MVQSRVACALTGAALSILVLTGCQGGEAGAAQTPSSSASASTSESEAPSAAPTPTPSPASAAGPAVNIPVPEKPALADENSVEGLEAFTEWWFELLNYAQATNDFEPLWAVTGPECDTCKNVEASTADSYAERGWLQGGEVIMRTFDSPFERTTDGTFESYVTTTQSALIVYDSSGNVIDEVAAYSDPAVNLAIAIYVEDSWEMTDVGSIGVD